jgi:hypothetical protein
MSLNIPATQEQADQNIARFESALGQNAPIATKAFLRVLGILEASQYTTLYKFAIERAKQNLALTATGDDLDLIGEEYGVIRKAAEAAVLTISLPAINGTVIPATVDFLGVANGVRYFPNSSVVAAGGFAVLDVTSEEVGIAGNLQVSDELTIGTQIAGAESTAAVIVIVNTGAEQESDEEYRVRVLDEIRSEGGGGNSFDYRRWSQEVAGVVRAFPYGGQPPLPGTPPDRTVYIEVSTTIDPDGLAPSSILTEVRDTITIDPDTGLTRQPLGLTDGTLFVLSITRSSFYVRITDLIVDASVEAETKDEIETALTNYFLALQPFVDGLDFEGDKNDIITALTISDIVQDIIAARGGSATKVEFGIAPGVFTATQETLDSGEKAKLGVTANADQGWKEETGPAFTDTTMAFSDTGTDVQIFAADDDRIYVGHDTVFEAIAVLLAIVSSADIAAVFEYWNGSAWTALTVTDGTIGFTQNGDITFTVPGDWASVDVNGSTKFYVRIQRTENTVVTPPTEDTIKIESDAFGITYV